MARVVLTAEERRTMRKFVGAVEELMLDFDADAVGRIADCVGERGTGGVGGAREDGAVLECLRVIVDAMGRG